MKYQDYLKTKHWQRVRGDALERAEYHCAVCGSSEERLHVHHNTYKRLGNERDADLVVLCEECHAIFHEHMATVISDVGRDSRPLYYTRKITPERLAI